MEEKKKSASIQFHIPLTVQDLIRNIWLVILAVMIAVMGVLCYSKVLHKPEYTTSVTFAISPRANGSYVGFYTSLQTASEMAEVFNEVFGSSVLKRMVREDLADPSQAFQVSTSLKSGTNILEVFVTAGDPLTSYSVMESVLNNYGDVSEYLFGNVVLDTIKSPHIPTSPSNTVNVPRAGLLAAVLAMFVMTAAIVLLSLTRSTLKTLSGAKYYMGESPLAVLVREKGVGTRRGKKEKGLLIWKPTISVRYTEAILQLAHKLFHRMKKENKKVLLVTSVAENEGKSTLAANLAIAFAKHGHRVALVDMDLRKPSLHKLLSQTDYRLGLEHFLGQEHWEDTPGNLFVVTADNIKRNAGQLLHDSQMDKFLQQLREKRDIVILDSAPYTAVADTGMLLKYADGCVMAVRQDWVPYKVLADVTAELSESNAEYMGYVLNYYIDDGSL